MKRILIVAGLIGLFSLALCDTQASESVPELMKREVSREGVEYLQKLRMRTPFGSKDFNLAALRAGMGSRRLPTIKDVKLIKTEKKDAARFEMSGIPGQGRF